MARYSMLIDLTRCIGCDACTVACKQENGTPLDTFFARVVNVEMGRYPDVKRVYLPMLCYHCANPACLKACPNKAIVKRADGIVLIDQDRCRGTGACVSACPYGNIILSPESEWYLNEDEPYERDFVKPRLREGVARKCTYCAHRVDEGLDPACVVACPTNARIFGDLDDLDSDLSKYIDEQREQTGRDTFHLLPEAGTRPAGVYLGTMSSQESATVSGPPQDGRRPARRTAPTALALLIALLLLLIGRSAFAQEPSPGHERAAAAAADVFATSTCVGCHGLEAMGGMGPPLAQTKLTPEAFLKTVREGKGMMPGSGPEVIADADVEAMRQELAAKPWNEDLIPIAFKVGQMLSTRNVAFIFLGVFAFALIFGLKVLLYWLRASSAFLLLPYLGKFGYFKAAWVVLKSLIVDGFLVASLWRTNKHRWLMHGLILYGFCGLMLADILMQIYNPARGDLPLSSPLKLLPIVSGVSVLLGVLFVQYRYKTDPYIDNGLTLGRDFLFVNLLFHTILSGFLTVVINRIGASDWLMTIYIYHLASIALLIATAPFTRFAHAWVVPCLVAVTRLTDEIAGSGVEIGFEREPSPGRHHKTLRIAHQLAGRLSPEAGKDVKIRYYP